MAIVAGTHLGPYEILSPLGTGGMGEVYLARDTQLHRRVAIKILPEKYASDSQLLARFATEARLASSLNHPNIVTIYSVGEAASIPYISMELVEGQNIEDLSGGKPLPLNILIKVAKQIADGLAKAHEAGIVHRDLKPQNVMVTTDGFVKILDFGLSKLTTSGVTLSTMSTWHAQDTPFSSSGAIIGTVAYMSPEQASGKPLDYRSDQFSFGSLLYQMAVGQLPFHRETAAQTLASIIEAEPPDLMTLNPAIPPGLASIVQRCMSKRPQDRYDSTAELAQDFDSLAQTLALSSASALKWTPTRTARRSTWLWVLIASVLLLLGTGVITPRIWRHTATVIQSQTLPGEEQIAILPFTNIGNEATNQVFIDGLVETLTSKLTQLEQFQGKLSVIPTSEIRRENTTSARDALRSFGANLVITGSVQRTADKIRLTVNLVDPKTSRQLKSRSIDTEIRDIAVLQDGIVTEVVSLLDLDLQPAALQTLSAGGTTVPGAYDFYLQGRGYLQSFGKIENVDSAVGLFQRSLENDPKYTLAYAGLGEAYWRKYEITKDRRWIEEAKKSCEKAIAINDKVSPVHVTMGLIDTGTGRYEDALSELQRAIQIDPVNGDAYREMAKAYEGMGKLPEAESVYKKAIELRPSYWAGYNELGRFYMRLARYAEAEKQFRRVTELTPDNPGAYSNLGGMYFLLRRYHDAASMFERSLAIMPTFPAYSNLGTLYFTLGRYLDSARNFERALEIDDRDYRVWHNLASAYRWIPGETEKGRSAFERAAKMGEAELRVNSRRPGLLINLADCYSMIGQTQRARDLLAQALTIGLDGAQAMFAASQVYEQLGDRDHALEWIAQALKNGYPEDLVNRSPGLARLRADPRFQQMQHN